MKLLQNILGGLAGALALNLIHETAKRLDSKAPHVDLVGEEAFSKSASALGFDPPEGETLTAATFAADVLSNAGVYAMIGQGKDENILLRGAVVGLVTGLGTVTVTGKLGLDDTPVTKTTATKIMTVAWYTAGGIVAAVVIRAMRNR